MSGVDPGSYRVVRTSGVVPPFLRKRTDGSSGWTCLGPLPVLPFVLRARPGRVELRYRGPLGVLVDRLTPALDGAWEGEATCLGLRYGRFRLEPRQPARPSR